MNCRKSWQFAKIKSVVVFGAMKLSEFREPLIKVSEKWEWQLRVKELLACFEVKTGIPFCNILHEYVNALKSRCRRTGLAGLLSIGMSVAEKIWRTKKTFLRICSLGCNLLPSYKKFRFVDTKHSKDAKRNFSIAMNDLV